MALCAARAVSAIGDQLAAVALVLLVSRDHPAKAVGGLLLAESLPMLLSTHAGAISDRFEARRLLIGCQVGQGVVFGLITIWLPPYWVLLALILLASLLGTLLRSTTQIALRAVVDDDHLLAANGALGTALWLGMMVGPALGGALAGLVGTRAALGVDTATFAVSAATLLVLPLLRPQKSSEADNGGAAAALRHAWRDPVLRPLLLGLTMMVAFAGIDNVALVFLVRDDLGQGSAAYGIAMAVFGVGMVAGSLLVTRYRNWRAERVLAVSVAGTAASTAMLGVGQSMAVVYPAQLIGGASNGLDVAAQTTIVQRITPPAMLGRMSGAVNSGVAVGFLVAYLGGGALVDATSPRTAFLGAGVGTAMALIVLRPVWRSEPRTIS